jgi:hypothetical protein
VRLSLFPDAYDSEPRPWEGSWQELVENFSAHDFSVRVKEECPAFSPAAYPEGTLSREKRLVSELSCFVVDADKLTEQGAADLMQLIAELGLCAVVYTTWSHAAVAPARYKLRVVAPLSRPVPGASWDAFWLRAASIFGGVCDFKCRNADRIYFAPFAPPGTEEVNWVEVFEGEPLDVDLVMRLDPVTVAEAAPEDQTPLSREALEKFAKNLARKRSDEQRSELGEILIKVVNGESFAEQGQRDLVLFKLCLVLGQRFSDKTPESVAEHFRPSFQLMERLHSEPPGWADKAVQRAHYKLRRVQESVLAEKIKEQGEKKQRIREAFKNGRDEPYTLEEVNSFGEQIGKRWIIQRGGSFYFFVAGNYVGPFTKDDMLAAADRELSPAISAGVSLYKVSKDGNVTPKTIVDLVRQYGTVAQRTVLDLRAQAARYDDASRTIFEAPCPMRPVAPKFHQEIDDWLFLMAGEKYEDLKSWLAAVTRLQEPCVALFLTGPKGTGKSLLALGISRIWTTSRPTPLEEVFGDFNETLASCPLCFADEQLPRDHRGYTKNAELRIHIQADRRPLKRKFQPNATLEGATRTIVAANNEDVLSTQENLSAFDIDAIIDRYFHVPTQPEARDYLEATNTDDWVSGDRIAEHVLWLVDNHPWERSGRFLIKVEDQGLQRQLVTNTGVRSAICQWLVGYLMNPKKFETDARSRMFVRVDNQRLLVNAQGIIECWEHYVKNEKCPFTGHLSRDLIALCKNVPRVRLENGNGKRVNYRVFNVDNLVAWAERSGFADRETILEALKRDTKSQQAVSASSEVN